MSEATDSSGPVLPLAGGPVSDGGSSVGPVPAAVSAAAVPTALPVAVPVGVAPPATADGAGLGSAGAGGRPNSVVQVSLPKRLMPCRTATYTSAPSSSWLWDVGIPSTLVLEYPSHMFQLRSQRSRIPSPGAGLPPSGSLQAPVHALSQEILSSGLALFLSHRTPSHLLITSLS